MNNLIFVACDDRALRTKITAAARSQLAECLFLFRGEHLSEKVKNFNPSMLIADLSTDDSDWILRHIGDIKMSRTSFPILGFVKSEEDVVKTRAERSGFDKVLEKKDFFKDLPELIDRYLRAP
jgi:hypothetical protein